MGTAQRKLVGAVALLCSGAAWAGALVGTISHILLDAVMHVDVRPFWPFVAANPMQGWVSIEALQWGCVAAGVAGLALLAARRG